MIKRIQTWLTNPTVQNWLVSVGTGTFVAQIVPSLSLAFRLLLLAITLICLFLNSPRIWQGMQNLGKTLVALLRNYWQFLFGLLGAIVIVWILQGFIFKPEVPSDVLEARRNLAEIQSSLSGVDVERWWAAEDRNGEPTRRLAMKGYELIEAENVGAQDQVLRTFIKDGKRIAEDILGPESYTFARRYYRDDCNFATDYFGSSGEFSFLVYDKDCRGTLTVLEVKSPIFSLPIPVFSYR
jgi:hypothetical protein